MQKCKLLKLVHIESNKAIAINLAKMQFLLQIYDMILSIKVSDKISFNSNNWTMKLLVILTLVIAAFELTEAKKVFIYENNELVKTFRQSKKVAGDIE